MKVVRNVTTRKETDEVVDQKPKYEKDDWVQIVAGEREGCSFVVADIRYMVNDGFNPPHFQYLNNGFPRQWVAESLLRSNVYVSR